MYLRGPFNENARCKYCCNVTLRYIQTYAGPLAYKITEQLYKQVNPGRNKMYLQINWLACQNEIHLDMKFLFGSEKNKK